MKKHILWILLILCFLFTGCNAKASAGTETKTLTLAVFGGSNLLQWVNLYNENHSDVKIEIVNYLDNYPDPYAALDQIKIEISAGKGPDMINFGSLYVVVPSYRIDSYTTTNSELAGLERMDIKQLVDAYDMLDDNSILFPGETKKTVFGMLCYGSLENYIDWGAGTCGFNSDSFKELLHFANQFPLSLNWADDYSAKEIIAEGRSLLNKVSIGNVYEIIGTRMLYGETPTYIGYPLNSGCGSMADTAGIAIGISSTSKNKEEAWRFVRSLLDSEFQDNIENGLPLRISSLEQILEDAMRVEYDINDEKIVKEVLRFDGDAPINIYEISAEDAETLKSIISKIEYNATVDRNLYNILLEEVDYLFNDDRNIDDVANIIQNRASVYISENK